MTPNVTLEGTQNSKNVAPRPKKNTLEKDTENKPVLAREREARYYLEKLPEERRERREKRDERIQIH